MSNKLQIIWTHSVYLTGIPATSGTHQYHTQWLRKKPDNTVTVLLLIGVIYLNIWQFLPPFFFLNTQELAAYHLPKDKLRKTQVKEDKMIMTVQI